MSFVTSCCCGRSDSRFRAQHRLASNERLEFLGDAILGSIVCERLFKQYPEYLEGDLTKIKSMVVSRTTCANSARRWGSTSF